MLQQSQVGLGLGMKDMFSSLIPSLCHCLPQEDHFPQSQPHPSSSLHSLPGPPTNKNTTTAPTKQGNEENQDSGQCQSTPDKKNGSLAT